ncbi:hypothetical protein LTR10_009320 [Elasticomyces elasticus]|nr:hypothetical protein LTR10_009320 [Elasticomyces elasticus]KAK4971581.1 hypothetical protein LTR42_007309 [Elasticomyces elasticus]
MGSTDTSIQDWILGKLNIHVLKSPGIPPRQDPLDVYCPYHIAFPRTPEQGDSASQNLDNLMRSAVPGAAARRLTKDDGVQAWIFDVDMERAFESALARETLWIAIEVFLDEQEGCADEGDGMSMLQRFRDYINELGLQPVTVTISSLVHDLMAAYEELGACGERFACVEDVEAFAEAFVRSRDCFFYEMGRQPYVEVTFASCAFPYREAELDLELNFTWAPPFVNFTNLRNSVSEGTAFSLQPSAIACGPVPTTIMRKYGVGVNESSWLQWDDTTQSLRGIIPHRRAAEAGALRLDAYTVTLHIMETSIQDFGGGVKWERSVRCVVPLTVKRKAEDCREHEETVLSPPLRAKGSQTLGGAVDRGRATPLREDGNTNRRKQYRGLDSGKLPVPRKPSRASSLAEENKENLRDSSMKELHMQLQRKAEQGATRPDSPLRLNSLTLARLHDGANTATSTTQTVGPAAAWSSNNPYRIFMAENMVENVAGSMTESMDWSPQTASRQVSEEFPSFQSDL